MTVLFACGGSYVSGLEIVELAVMRGLATRGHRVHALVSGWNDGDFIGRLRAAGIPHTVAFTGKISLRRPAWMLDTLRHLPGARQTVRRLVGRLRPDVVVACNRDAVILLAGVWGRAPVVFHVHELMAPAWTARVARRVRGFVAVSEFVAERLVADGVARERVRVVHNGVEPAPGVDRPAEAVPVGGICGQIGAWKGHDDLVDALALVAARGVPFRLHVYGRGDEGYVAALKARVEAVGLAGQVEWRGFEPDPDRMYAGIDVLTIPSRFEEPFGLTAAEAGIRAIPVVATRRGGLPEIVADGATGRLVAPEAPAALADAIASVLTDADRRRAMGAAARARVESRFLTGHMVDRFEAVVRDAA